MSLSSMVGSSELALSPDAHVGAFLAAVRGFFDQAHQDALGVVDESLSEQREIVETLGEQNRVLQVQVAQLEAARKEAETAHTAAEGALKAENEALRQELERMQAERDVLNGRVDSLEVYEKTVKAIEQEYSKRPVGSRQVLTVAQLEHWRRIDPQAYSFFDGYSAMVYALIKENKRK